MATPMLENRRGHPPRPADAPAKAHVARTNSFLVPLCRGRETYFSRLSYAVPTLATPQPIRGRDRFRAIAFAVAAGCLFIWFNFNGLIRNFTRARWPAESHVSTAVIWVSLLPKQILSPSAETLYFWVFFCFIALWMYVTTVLLLAVVRGRWSLAKWGIAGTISGGLALPVICWTGLIAWIVLRFFAKIAGFIFHGLAVVFTWIVKAIVFAAPVLVPLAFIAVLVRVWKAYGPKLVFSAVGVLGLLYLLIPVWRWMLAQLEWLLEKIAAFFAWVGEILARLFRWIGPVIVWCIKALLIVLGITSLIGIIGCIGHVLIDQLKTAMDAGKSQKALFAASFSIGVSLALVLLVAAGRPEVVTAPVASPVASPGAAPARTEMLRNGSEMPKLAKPNRKRRKKRRAHKPQPSVAPTVVTAPRPPVPAPVDLAATIDRVWSQSTFVFKGLSPTHVFHTVLPTVVREWARTTFGSISAPMFDVVLLALILSLSVFGLLRGIFSRSEIEYKIRFYNSDLLLIAVIPLLVVLLVLNASAANQE